MKCVAVCQDPLVVTTLHQALATTFDIEFLIEDPALARQLHATGIRTRIGNPRKIGTYREAEVTPATCVIVEDDGRRRLREILDAVAGAGTSLIYVLAVHNGPADGADAWARAFPDVSTLTLSELAKGPLLGALGRSLIRARVKQYQRHFEDADRILILLHNDPDPDAMASGLALRTLLRRTKTTAIIGAFHGVSRPENVRMVNLLDIHVESVTAETLARFDRIATVDVQPHYFGGLLNRVDLVVDHHPERSGYTTTFKDIRPTCGSTATILTEHLRAVDINISERIATAMLYAIKSDTLFLSRQTDRSDLDAFTFLYPLADPALVRKMEGSGISVERMRYVARAVQGGTIRAQVFTAHVGTAPREDLVTYVADFLLQLEDVKWTIVAGVVKDHVVISVRSVGYLRSAGDFVRTWFGRIGSAGGHRAMAKAVVSVDRFDATFGRLDPAAVTKLLSQQAAEFLSRPHVGARSTART